MQEDMMSRTTAGKKPLKAIQSNHVKRQVAGSTIIKTAKDVKLYEQWNAKLEREGLRAFDDTYRGNSEYASAQPVPDNQPGNAQLEYYDVFRDYCRYFKYDLFCMVRMLPAQKKPFIQMIGMYVNGISMREAYRAVSAEHSGTIGSAVYFYKRFAEVKREYLANFQNFSAYMTYCKYEYGTVKSYEAWMAE